MEPENTGGKPDGRDGAGRFVKGLPSGNPSGRPKGSRNRTTVMAQELLDGEGGDIVRKAIEMAKAGEPVALRLCVDRIVPRRAGTVEIELPKLRAAADVAEACAAVIAAAAAGELTLGEARDFMGLLDVQRKAIETHDLAVRVQLLEKGGVR